MTLTRADVERICEEARECGEVPYLSGLDLSGLDLSGLDLHNAILSTATMRRVNLREADLSGASMFRVDLSGSDLSRAKLRFADLSETDLSRVSLRFADLFGALLLDACLHCTDLTGTDLSGAEDDTIHNQGELTMNEINNDYSRIQRWCDESHVCAEVSYQRDGSGYVHADLCFDWPPNEEAKKLLRECFEEFLNNFSGKEGEIFYVGKNAHRYFREED